MCHPSIRTCYSGNGDCYPNRMTEEWKYITVWSFHPPWGWPRLSSGLVLLLSLLDPSSPRPPLLHCWLLNQHSARKTPSQGLLSRAPNLQWSHFSPLTAMTLPEAPGMTNIMATFSDGLSSRLFFSSPLGQEQGEEKTSKGAVWGLYKGLYNSFWCTQRVKGFPWSMQGAVLCLF